MIDLVILFFVTLILFDPRTEFLFSTSIAMIMAIVSIEEDRVKALFKKKKTTFWIELLITTIIFVAAQLFMIVFGIIISRFFGIDKTIAINIISLVAFFIIIANCIERLFSTSKEIDKEVENLSKIKCAQKDEKDEQEDKNEEE